MSKLPMKKAREPITPMKIVNDLWAARTSLALAAAVDLDIFTLIAQGNKTPADIAKALRAPKRGVERLVDSLVAIGYVTKRGAQLGLTPLADTFLVRTKSLFIGQWRMRLEFPCRAGCNWQRSSEAANRCLP